MVPDAGTPSSMASAVARAFDLAPAETAPRRALERSLEFFSRKVNIWKRVILGKWRYISMVFKCWKYQEIVFFNVNLFILSQSWQHINQWIKFSNTENKDQRKHILMLLIQENCNEFEQCTVQLASRLCWTFSLFMSTSTCLLICWHITVGAVLSFIRICTHSVLYIYFRSTLFFQTSLIITW